MRAPPGLPVALWRLARCHGGEVVVAAVARRLELLAEGVEQVAAPAARRLGIAPQQLDPRSSMAASSLLFLDGLGGVNGHGAGQRVVGQRDLACGPDLDEAEIFEPSRD